MKKLGKPKSQTSLAAQLLGRLGGRVKNAKRAAASRRNGVKGGRPKRAA